MKRAQIDDAGNLHCWRCGSTAFTRQRTVAGKVGMGVLAPKQTKCMSCGAFQAKGKPKKMPQGRPAGPAFGPGPMPPPTAGPPPGWYNDPGGAPVQRWWDGVRWTEHTQAPPGHPPVDPPS